MSLFHLHWSKRSRPYSFADAVRAAEVQLRRAAASGLVISDDLLQPVVAARQVLGTGTPSLDVQRHFFTAYARLAKATTQAEYGEGGGAEDAFEDARVDAELLLKYAAEAGVRVPEADARAVLMTCSSERGSEQAASARTAFYVAYARLAKRFGDVTAQTIRNCSSVRTLEALRRDRRRAAGLTMIVAFISVFTFMADSMSKAMLHDIDVANEAAAKLRVSLTTIPQVYAKDDPCEHLADIPADNARSIQNVGDVQALQQFAVTNRDLLGRATKLNWIAWVECSPFARCGVASHDQSRLVTDLPLQNNYLQVNPAILNYTAEVLCRIKSYQLVRSFATNVEADYAALIGGVTAYALPIVYALLGAYAYRLRLFADTIRKRTYHPSFSDSARMVTAVIVGAIAGLFNPAQGIALSPLATAFLLGYGVELFFKFLDTLAGAFGSRPANSTHCPG